MALPLISPWSHGSGELFIVYIINASLDSFRSNAVILASILCTVAAPIRLALFGLLSMH